MEIRATELSTQHEENIYPLPWKRRQHVLVTLGAERGLDVETQLPPAKPLTPLRTAFASRVPLDYLLVTVSGMKEYMYFFVTIETLGMVYRSVNTAAARRPE